MRSASRSGCCGRTNDVAMTRTREWLYGWLLLLPAMALLALFTHYPAVANLWHSFYSTPRGSRQAVFVGVDHYRQLADDPIFWQALSNNLWYALGTIPLSIALALMMAAWVNGRIAGRSVLRLAYRTPTILPMIAVANIWLFFYTPEYGLLEQFLRLFGVPTHNWLGSQSTALPAMMVVAVWKEAGFLPYRNDHHRGERRRLAPEPVVRRDAEQTKELLEQAVLGRVKEKPDVGDGDHRKDRRRAIGETQHATPGD